MCLAVPLRVKEILGNNMLILEGNGVRLEACSVLVPEIKIGDNCLVHAGFVIEKLTPEDAEEKLKLFREFYDKIGVKHEL